MFPKQYLPRIHDSSCDAVTLLTGSLSAEAKRTANQAIETGQAGVVIGTHALLSESVTFARLGLVIIDEQHRFGVEQRAALSSRAGDGVVPHVLVMTATPIPRTAAGSLTASFVPAWSSDDTVTEWSRQPNSPKMPTSASRPNRTCPIFVRAETGSRRENCAVPPRSSAT
jgi:hypothetical protein